MVLFRGCQEIDGQFNKKSIVKSNTFFMASRYSSNIYSKHTQILYTFNITAEQGFGGGNWIKDISQIDPLKFKKNTEFI